MIRAASMPLLVLSLLALGIAPLLAPWLQRHPMAAHLTDGFVVAGILALTAGHIVPHSIALAGPPALLAWVIGLVVPALAHGGHTSCHHRRLGPLVGFAVVALGLHAMLDGVALVAAQTHSLQSSLAFAVTMHRLLEGLSIWWLTQRSHLFSRLAALCGSALATVLGYALGLRAQAFGFTETISLVQAAAAGSLLHVLAHHPHETAGTTKTRMGPLASSAGACLALALVLGLGEPESAHGAALHPSHGASHGLQHVHGPEAFIGDFWVATGLAALMTLAWTALEHAWRPRGPTWTPRLETAAGWRPTCLDAMRGAWRGITSSLCACGVLPLFASQRSRGASSAEASAYVVAAPSLGPCAMILSYLLLGWQLTLLRLVGIFVLASGLAVGAHSGRRSLQSDASPQSPELIDGHPSTGLSRLKDGVNFAFGDVLTFLAPWLLGGLVLANTLNESIRPQWLSAISGHVAGPWLFAVLAAPFYLCSAASTLVAAVLLRLGASAGCALTMVLISSSISWVGGEALARMFGRRRAIFLFVAIMVGASVLGMGVDALMPMLLAPASSATGAPRPAVIASVGLIILFWGAFRQGMRGVLEQLATPNRSLASHHHHHS